MLWWTSVLTQKVVLVYYNFHTCSLPWIASNLVLFLVLSILSPFKISHVLSSELQARKLLPRSLIHFFAINRSPRLVVKCKLTGYERMSGPECCSNPPNLNPRAGAGHVEKLAGLDAYLTGSPNSKLALLLVSDIFGYEAPNLRKLADKIAAAGYYVVVPDFLDDEPYNPENPNRPLPVWLKDHGTDKGFEAAKPIIEALKSKGVSAIGAVGFCWGAKVVVELAKSRLIRGAVLLHPSFVTVDDIKGVDIPIAVLGAENDKMSPPELLKQFEEVLAAKPGVDCYVKIFPKVSHGWSVRYSTEDAEAVKAAEEAHQDLLGWFAKHLK